MSKVTCYVTNNIAQVLEGPFSGLLSVPQGTICVHHC